MGTENSKAGMDSASFKRNVFRTLSPKTSKAGLRGVARTTPGVHIMYAITGLNTEVGALMESLKPFVLGFQLNSAMKQDAFLAFGGVSYFAVMLAKVIKAKVPGSGKKVHLHGLTKTEALLKLNSLSNDLMYTTMRVFRNEEWDLDEIKAQTEEVLQVLWPLIYDLLGVAPALIFEDYCARLAPGFPEGLFSVEEAQYKPALAALKEQEAVALKKPLPEADAEASAEADTVH